MEITSYSVFNLVVIHPFWFAGKKYDIGAQISDQDEIDAIGASDFLRNCNRVVVS